MPNWNGRSITVEAHRIAVEIATKTGLETFPDNFNIADVKSLLRRLYVATGGKRGAGVGFDPSTQQLRDVFNGKRTGAEIWALHSGETPTETKGEASGAPASSNATSDDSAATTLRKLIGFDEGEVFATAKRAVDARVGDILASVHGLIADEVSKQVRTLEVKVAGRPDVKLDKAHKAFQHVLAYAANRIPIMMVGPAGSGKTTIGEQVAEVLGLAFYMSGKCADEIKITGYMDASGTYRTTAFRQAYENGGVFLFDEMDGWSPDALIAVNAPLAGQWGDFPDGMIKRHPDFVPIAAANTFGRGADRQYVGREQLDAATLDRFAVVVVDYDEDLEAACSCNRAWTNHVQKIRAAVETEKVRHVVSPRASIMGGIMLAAGRSKSEVEDELIWKGLDEPVRNRVKAHVR